MFCSMPWHTDYCYATLYDFNVLNRKLHMDTGVSERGGQRMDKVAWDVRVVEDLEPQGGFIDTGACHV